MSVSEQRELFESKNKEIWQTNKYNEDIKRTDQKWLYQLKNIKYSKVQNRSKAS